MNFEDSRVIKLEQEKLDKLGIEVKISMSSGTPEMMEKGMPSKIGFNIPLKGNKSLIETLKRNEWICAYREKRNESFFVQIMHKHLHYQKYAVYKNPIGLYAKEYYDSAYELKRVGLTYIREDALPVTVNRTGGYTSFIEECDKKNGFVEIVTVLENEEPLTREQMYPINSDKFKLGWIDRAGNTYACGFEGHRYAAEAICKELGYKCYDHEQELEKKGWIKIYRPAPYTWENRDQSEPYFNMRDSEVGEYISAKQYERLCELGHGDCIFLEMWLRNGVNG